MRAFLLLPFLFLLFGFQQAKAQPQMNLYVDSSVAASGAGTSWAAAYKTLNEALNVANNGSTTVSYNVHVAKGTYYPTGAQSGTNRNSSFLILRNGMRVYGGYPVGGGTRNATTNRTTLSGDIGVPGDSSDNSYSIMGVNNIPTTGDSVILDGFVVRDGNGGNNRNGGGLWIDSAYANTVLSNCIIRNNNANNGGGLYMTSSSITFLYNYFLNNSAAVGGAAYIVSNVNGQNIYECAFLNNRANRTGGAVYYYDGGSYSRTTTTGFWNCTFTGNSALGLNSGLGGGALYSDDGLTLNNCSFTQNTASAGGALRAPNSWKQLNINKCDFSYNSASVGGALYVELDGLIDSSTFLGNKATSGDGGAIYVYQSFSPNLDNFICSNTLFDGNTALMGKGGAVADRVILYTSSSVYGAFNNCTFLNDSARSGGALLLNTITEIRGCSFLSNYAFNKGGALYDSANRNIMDACQFRGNRADTAGGALCVEGPQSRRITSTLFTGNWGGQQGGAIALLNTNGTGSSILMQNITLAGDSATSGNGLYCTNSSPSITNSILWEGALNTLFTVNSSFPTITNSAVEGGFTGAGNISTTPAFIAPQPATAAPTTAGDYSVPNCSPTVNAAGSAAWYASPIDVAGNPRFAGSAYDMGAYEFQPSTVAGVITSGLRDTVCMGTPMQFTSSVSGGTWTHSSPTVATLSASGLVTGIAQGMDTIRYTVVSNGCSATVQKVIWVLPSPARPGYIWGTNTLCEGYSATYTISFGGGVWSTSDTNIAVITYPTTPTVNNRGDIIARMAGTVKIFATQTNTYGCMSQDSITVTVQASPVVTNIIGDTTVCNNSTRQLSNATPGGVWEVFGQSSSNGLTVDSTGLVSASAIDSGYILYTVVNANGCSTIAYIRMVVTPNPAPQLSASITGPPVVCVNSSAQYTIPLTGGVWSIAYGSGSITTSGLYTATQPFWFDEIVYAITNPTTGCVGRAMVYVTNQDPDNKSISASFCGAANANYNFNGRIIRAAGVYRDTFQNQYGCDSFVTFTYTDLGPNIAVTQSGGTLTAVETNASYSWFECVGSNRVYVGGAIGRSFTPRYSGQYGVWLYKPGCTLASACYPVIVSAVSNISTENWNLYPNPTSGSATLQTGSVIAKTILVRDVTGKLLLELKPTGAETVIDTKGFAPGVYLVTVADGEGNTPTLRLTVAK